MANLQSVVKELQAQRETNEEINQGIKALVAESVNARKATERAKGDEREAALKASSKARTATVAKDNKPQSLAQGLSKGLGLEGLAGGLKAMLAPFLGTFAGVLGGATLTGIIGSAIGLVFRGALGAFLGKKYLQPLVDKMIPDWIGKFNIFGEGEGAINVEELSAMVLGGVGLIFGPKLIGKLISKGVGALGGFITSAFVSQKPEDFIDDAGKKSIGDKVKGRAKWFGRSLLRNFALAGLVGFIGSIVGEKIGDLTGSEELGNAISQSAQWAALGATFFGPTGAIVAGLASLAFFGVKSLVNWLDGKRAETEKALENTLNEADKKFNDAIVNRDFAAAEAAMTEAYNTAERMRQINAQKAKEAKDLVAAEAQKIYEVDPSIKRAQMAAQAQAEAASQELDYTPEGKEATLDKGKLAIKNMMEAHNMSYVDAVYDVLSNMQPLDPSRTTFEAEALRNRKQWEADIRSTMKPIVAPVPEPAPIMDVGSPIVSQKTGELIGDFTPNIQWDKVKGIPGFSNADMFGDGNVFTNGKPPVTINVNNVDNSSNDNKSIQNTQNGGAGKGSFPVYDMMWLQGMMQGQANKNVGPLGW